MAELSRDVERPRDRDVVEADDHRAIRECLKGRTAAFGELVRRYEHRLYHTVYRILGNSEDAQDVMQEAFINAFENLGSFKGDSQFSTWLFRITVNAALSHRRTRKVVLSLESLRASNAGVEPLDESVNNQPSDGLEQQDEEIKLQAALNRLSSEHRVILILKELEGRKYDEIAAILDVPVGTVRSRLHRARFELRAILEQPEG
jgi:RNA polymerase sigma-70 factor (ECF subfamily)